MASRVELAIEALLVAADRPVRVEEIVAALPGEDVEGALNSLERFWSGRGMRLVRARDGLRLVRAPEAEAILAAIEGRRGRRLTQAAVETLAVIAMHQPVTLQDIERLRGVRLSRGIMDSLLDAGLVRVSLRRTDAGRAATYVTTERFLEHYGLGALTDLPTPEELRELINPPTDPSGGDGLEPPAFDPNLREPPRTSVSVGRRESGG
jgi:Predicted transcriptional regulator containing the HTH domain